MIQLRTLWFAPGGREFSASAWGKAISALTLVAGMGAVPAWAHEGGHGNEAMWQACEAKQINDSCSFTNAAKDIYRGSCQSMADHLVCIRNRPIELAEAQSAEAQSALANSEAAEAVPDQAPVQRQGQLQDRAEAQASQTQASQTQAPIQGQTQAQGQPWFFLLGICLLAVFGVIGLRRKMRD